MAIFSTVELFLALQLGKFASPLRWLLQYHVESFLKSLAQNCLLHASGCDVPPVNRTHAGQHTKKITSGLPQKLQHKKQHHQTKHLDYIDSILFEHDYDHLLIRLYSCKYTNIISFTYSRATLNVDISSLVNEVGHCFKIPILNCHMQGSRLMERMKQSSSTDPQPNSWLLGSLFVRFDQQSAYLLTYHPKFTSHSCSGASGVNIWRGNMSLAQVRLSTLIGL